MSVSHSEARLLLKGHFAGNSQGRRELLDQIKHRGREGTRSVRGRELVPLLPVNVVQARVGGQKEIKREVAEKVMKVVRKNKDSLFAHGPPGVPGWKKKKKAEGEE